MAAQKNRFGPSKPELKFRLWVSGAGLCALVAALIYRGWPPGFAMLEVMVIGGLFFGITFFLSWRKLQRGDFPER
jgi:hypothetical protein